MQNFNISRNYLRQFKSICSNTKHLSSLKGKPQGKDYPSSQRVYSWGYAATGSLGIPNVFRDGPISNIQHINYPHNLMFFKENNYKISSVAAGCGFSLFSVNRKIDKLLGTGVNTDSQIGYHELAKSRIADYITRPVYINTLSLNGSKILDIAAGRAHTLVLLDDGKVYSFGNNAYGQCGRKVVDDEEFRGNQVITELDIGEPVSRVYAGQDHSILLTKSGGLFSFGISTDGQLGRKCSRGFDYHPKRIDSLSGIRIKDVSCRSDTVLAISDEGILFGWGNNEYSQLEPLLKSEAQILEPVEMSVNIHDKIISCAAGPTSCLAVGSSGTVFSWGYGPLGRGPAVEYDNNPKEIPPKLFGRNELNPNSRPVSASAGVGYFMVTTESGDLYSWGRNKFGTCGIGVKEKELFFPLKITERSFHSKYFRNFKGNGLAEFSPNSVLAKFVAASPDRIRPFLQLIRLERPIGVYLLFLPTCWGTALAAHSGSFPNIFLMTLFFIGATLMRSAGCIINDVWDRRFDRKVERTKSRPVASGAIRPASAIVYAAGLSLSAALLVLLPLRFEAQLLAICALPIVLTYPAAKRFTNWPQVALGLCYNWGIPVGYVAATTGEPFGNLLGLASAATLYTSGIAWTLFYDSIYAYQDYEDDKIAGVKSTALTWGRDGCGRKYLWMFGSSFFLGTAASFYLADLNQTIAVAGLAATASHLVWQMRLIGNLENRHGECGRAFRSNASLGVIVLATIALGKLFN